MGDNGASPAETPYWGKIIVDILKKLLEFNQLTYGTRKSF